MRFSYGGEDAPDTSYAGRESSFLEKEGARGIGNLVNTFTSKTIRTACGRKREREQARERGRKNRECSILHISPRRKFVEARCHVSGRQTRGAKRIRRALRVALPLLARVCVRACVRVCARETRVDSAGATWRIDQRTGSRPAILLARSARKRVNISSDRSRRKGRDSPRRR